LFNAFLGPEASPLNRAERLSEAVAGLVLDRSVSSDERARKDQLSSDQQEHRSPIICRKVDAKSGDEAKLAGSIKATSRQRAKGEYLQIEPEELEAIAIESKRTMDIDGFVPP
jgi:non-homologous end joining protein Ku